MLPPTGQNFLSTQSISTQSDLLRQEFKANAGPSYIPEWQQTELEEHTAGVETMHGTLSLRVSATLPEVNATSNDSTSSLLLQPEQPPRLGTDNTGTQGIGSSGQDGTNQTQDAPNETTFGAATATPVSQESAQTEQADPPVWRKMRRKMATRTYPWTLLAAVNETATDQATEDTASSDCSSHPRGDSIPATVNETATGKAATEDDNTSSDSSSHLHGDSVSAAVNETAADQATEDTTRDDCSSHHHGDSNGAEPRDDSNEQKPDSKRKAPQDGSSPKKFRYSVFWV